MFGSEILEVGVGLVLIFLLVSLILTAVRETIESWSKTRSRDLERAIAELLDDKSQGGLRDALYNHPLVSALFPGAKAPSKVSASGAIGAARNLPSYIPRETFALALFDLLKADQAKALDPNVAPSERIRGAFDVISRTAGQDPERIRKHLEQWYDASMDRASGWYRRRTQKLLFWLGLGIAFFLNINAFVIAQYLATHDAARAQVAKISDKVLEDQEVVAVLRDEALARSAAAAERGRPEGADNAVAPAGNASDAAENATAAPEPVGKASAVTVVTPTARAKAIEIRARLQDDLAEAGLPLGWNRAQLAYVERQLEQRSWFERIAFLLSWLAGFVAIGFAATLGAPFWFDVLGKVMVIRSTVKPTEKSPDEASKDGGTGGAPKPRPQDADDKVQA